MGLRVLDTGSMYRAAAWKALRLGLDTAPALAAMIRSTTLGLEEGRVTCDGADVTAALRDPGILGRVRPIADSPECRLEMVRLQREIGRAGGLVTEGRDQGSVVFPDAEFKFYLDAALEVRAARRQREEGGDLETIRGALARRDAEDRARKVGPLVRPPGAVEIDTSDLTPGEVVARMAASIGPLRPDECGSA